MANYREPQWLLPNEKNLQYPDPKATQGSGLTADRHSLYSMDFNGTSDYIDCGNPTELQITGSLTLSAWVKTSMTSTGFVISKDNLSNRNYGLVVVMDGGTLRARFFIFESNVLANVTSTTINVGDNNWHHIVGVNDGTDLKIYVDGDLEDTNSGGGGAIDNDTVNLNIGRRGDNNLFFNGQIDEAAIFPRALSSDEIDTLYNNGSPSNPMLLSGKPVAYYPLGEQARKPDTANWRFPNEVLQGQAINFDGSSGYITTDIIDLGTENSISFWFNQNLDGNTQFLIGSPDGANRSIVQFDYNRITIRPDGNTQFLGPYRSPRPPFNFPGVWGHYLITRNGNTVRLFVNGQEQTVSGSGTMSANTRINAIGAGLFPSPARVIDGQLSNIAIWNSDQSANIDNIYNYGAPQTSYTVTPTAWYKLDKTSKFTGLNPNWHSALDFVASESDYIDCGDSDSLSFGDGTNDSPFSISGWFYFDATGSYGLVSKYGTSQTSREWMLYTTGSKFRLLLYDTNNQNAYADASDTTIVTNKWYHVVATYNGAGGFPDAKDGIQIYVNGHAETMTPTGGVNYNAMHNTGRNVHLGSRSDTSYLDGKISNVAIYNQVISAEDVKYLYNGGTPQTNISFEPVSWWKLDNTGTGIQDSGSASNDGTNNGTTAVSSSVAVDEWVFENTVQSQTPNWSSALDFNGSSNYVQIPYNASITPQTGNFTISAWVNTNDLSGWHPIWSTQNLSSSVINVALHTFNDKVRATVGGSTDNPSYGGSWALFLDSTQSLTTSTWNHIAVTYNMSGNAQIYINGNPDNSGPIENPQTNWSTGDRFIGDGENFWDGTISNVAIFNTALDSTAIQALYNNGQPETAISSSPVSWWKLDNTTTGIQDSGSASNNGTNNGATEIQTNVWTPRLNADSDTLPSTALVSSNLQFNSAYSSFSLDFDGAGDYIDCTNDSIFNLTTGMTISAWINPTVAAADKFLVAKRWSTNSYQIATAGSINPQCSVWIGSTRYDALGSTVLSAGTWYHIVGTFDGSNVKVYLNGVLEDTTPASGSLDQSTDIVSIAKGLNNNAYNFNGKIDETAIWNRALNQAEITSIYNNGYPKDITALAPISWWRLGEDAYFNGSDFIIPNQITGAPNGTSDNMTATDLVADAPGSYAAGLGSSLVESDRVGDAPLSTANSLSFNMTPENRISYPAGYTPTQVDNIYSMDFDGANDAVIIVNSASVDTVFQSIGNENSYSISAWVNTTSTINTGYATWYTDFTFTELRTETSLQTHCPFYLGMDNGKIFFGRTPNHTSSDERFLSTGTINDGNWKHIVVTVSTNALSMYINGSLDSSHTFTTAIGDCSVGTTTSNFQIGARTTNTGVLSSFADAKIDEVAIFDYALTPKQIKQDIYNGTTSGKTADLNNISNLTAPVAWYRMGD